MRLPAIQQYEEYERGRANKPQFKKPWPTFTEDIKALSKELLVVHDTPDNMPKQSRKKVKTPKGIIYQQGDTARGSLHSDTYYGAIEKDGEIRYVVRRALSSLKETDIDNIVDDKVKEIIKAAVDKKGFKLAFEEGIYMNESKKILIKKVRCYYKAKEPLHIRNHRDKSDKEYKRQFHVETDGNYCFAIYEGIVKGKIKRTFDVVNMLDAARYYRRSSDIRHSYPISAEVKNGLRYRCLLKTGTMLILLQSYDEEIDVSNSVLVSKRLYYVAIMKKDGRIILRHHQEAREASELSKERNAGAFNDSDAYRSEISMSMSNFNALVEGYDFEINALGEIILKNN